VNDGSLIDRALAPLRALAEASPEREVCGFVLRDSAGGAEVLPARNAAPDPTRGFAIGAMDVLAMERLAARQGCSIAALYHSHPSGGAVLSALDVECLSVNGLPLLPGVDLWVIALRNGRVKEVRAYRFEGGAPFEVDRLLFTEGERPIRPVQP